MTTTFVVSGSYYDQKIDGGHKSVLNNDDIFHNCY